MMRRQTTQLLRLNIEREYNLVTRAENLPIPKRISDLHFDDIRELQNPPLKSRHLLREMIDGATAAELIRDTGKVATTPSERPQPY